MSVPLKVSLPGIRLAWTQWSPLGAETFVRYNVYRREPAVSSAWTRIAAPATVGVVTYTDYATRSRAVYEYAVTVTALLGGIELEGAKQSPPPVGRVEFDTAFLHDVAAAGSYAQLPSHNVQVSLSQDIAFVPVWGRQQPTAQVGEQIARTATVTGLPLRSTDAQWADVTELVRRQRDSAALLCLRLGRDGLVMFCAVAQSQKAVGQKSYDPSTELQEVHYTEAV